MDGLDKPILLVIVACFVAVLGWAGKGIVEGIIKRFFDQAEELKEKNETMLTEKMNIMRNENREISASNKMLGEELVRSKIMMQSLNHQIDAFRAELRTSDSNQKKNNEYMVAIFRSFQAQLNKNSEEITTIGKVIMRMPEGK